MDRATVVNIKGSSWRLRQHEALTKPLTDLAGPPENAPRRRELACYPEFGLGANFGEAKNANFDERLQPITDVDLFVEGLLSSREPFRLWGVANDVSNDYTEVEAVDLHIGQRIRIEVSRNMMRVHLRQSGCSNAIARLASNLQHHVDGGLSATDFAIQRQLVAEQPVAA